MKRLSFLLVPAAFVACSTSGASEGVENTATKDSVVTEVKSLEFEYMDTTVAPQDDFYQFACGTWLKENPIPEEESRWGSFNEIDEKNNSTLNTILETSEQNPGEKGSASQLIGDFYATYMDTIKRNELGAAPLMPFMDEIDLIASKEDLTKELAQLHNVGIDPLFGVYVEQDAKINDKYIVHISQGGLGLPNRDYYFNEDDRSKNIREKYKSHVVRMFDMSDLGVDPTAIETSTYKIEEQLAGKSMGPVELRDMEAQYNKYTLAELNELAPNIDWNSYLSSRGLKDVDTVIVSQVEFLKEMNGMINSVSIEDWKNYLKWNVLNTLANKLSMNLERANFDFYSRTMRGTKKMKPLWKRAIRTVSFSAIGEALGEAFVEENFTEEAKRKVNEMVDNIILVFDERIEGLDWMGDSTKIKAKEKLGSFARKLGFPDNWTDYKGLEIDRESYLTNVININKFDMNENIEKLGKPIDKTKWEMVPQIVNAYYNPLLNEIVFPAGIMQAPFFSEHYEDAVNYARMGAVIGHELTHGFDDQGAQFTADGRMVNWWTAEDKEKFDSRTQKLIDQYSSYEVLDDVFINGQLTLGENIADLGGLTIAYHAYEKSLEGKEKEVVNGYTPEQRFFIAFAHVWKNNILDDALVMRVKTDPHSPGKYRVNGVVSNMPEFFEAFDVKEGDAMRQPADKIAKIW